jgi:HSP20 family protein
MARRTGAAGCARAGAKTKADSAAASDFKTCRRSNFVIKKLLKNQSRIPLVLHAAITGESRAVYGTWQRKQCDAARPTLRRFDMFFAPATVVRRSAYAPAFRALDRFLDEALTTSAPPSSGAAGQTAVSQDDKAVTLTFDLPGVSREQLTIGIEGNVVRIGTVADAPRTYAMAYELPQEIDASASEAKLEHGVLTLKLARKQPVSNVTVLPIN